MVLTVVVWKYFWQKNYRIVNGGPHYEREIKVTHPQFTNFQQDTQALGRFCDKQFDLTLSIGMMEHICDRAMLERFASEIYRVSKQYILIVPWKYA